MNQNHSTPSLKFLRRMTTAWGMVQHSVGPVPDWNHGYCLDDNGRALALMTRYAAQFPEKAEDIEDLTASYLGYTLYCSRSDGWMRNFATHDLHFKEEIGSHDSFARAIWGLGECAANYPNPEIAELATQIFFAHIDKVSELSPMRAPAYAMLGLCAYLDAYPDDQHVRDLLEKEVARLTTAYNKEARPDWEWYQDFLSYSNALIPWAHIKAGQVLQDDKAIEIGLKALKWLLSQTEEQQGAKRIAVPIGNKGWYFRGKQKAKYDQQPVDVGLTVLAAAEAYRLTKDAEWLDAAKRWYGWYLGENSENKVMVNQRDGWCSDGLHHNAIDQNHGAETIILYLMSELEFLNLH